MLDLVSSALSLQQEQLWFAEQNGLQRASYNEARALSLRGPLDEAALAMAFGILIGRHPLLRTAFPVRDGVPVRVQLPRDAFRVGGDGLAPDVMSQTEGTAQASILAFCEKPYALDSEPLVRLGCFSRAPDDRVLVLAAHHILTDGRSFERLLAELGTIYSALHGGQPIPAPRDEPAYDAYISWQRGYLDSAEAEKDRAFWREALAGAPSRLSLRGDRGAPASFGNRGAVIRLSFPEDARAFVKAAASALQITPFAVLLGAYCLHLHETCEQDDLIVGTGAPGRPGPAWRDGVGLFANMLPIRSRMQASSTLGEFLRAQADTLYDALDHQFIPFNVIASLVPADDARYFRPLVQHVCTFWPRAPAPNFAGLTVGDIDLDRTRSRFTTLAEVVRDGNRLSLALEHDSEEVPSTDAEAFAEGYLARIGCLAGALSEPLGQRARARRRSATARDRSDSAQVAPAATLGASQVAPNVRDHVLDVWRSVLDRPVSAGSNFFEIGGRSILALQIASALSHSLGVHVPTRLLFEHPVANDFCLALQSLMPAPAFRSHRATMPAAPPDARLAANSDATQTVPLLQTQLQIWIDEKLSSNTLGDFTASVAYRIRGPLDRDALASAVKRVSERHDMLRANLDLDADGMPVWRIAPHSDVDLEQLDCMRTAQATRQQTALQLLRTAAQRRIAMHGGPLHRFLLIRLDPGEHLFLVSQHHLVTDALSMRVLLRDLGRAYASARAGGVMGDHTAPPNFATLVADESAWLSSAEADRQRDFWRETLADVTGFALHTDNRTAVRGSPRTDACTAVLSPQDTAALVEFARSNAASPFLIMLASWAACLADWHHVGDLVIGLNVENRPAAEGPGALGCFVNPLPIRVRMKGVESYRGLLVRVTEAFHGAYANQRLPYREIVKIASARPRPGQMPLCRTTVDWIEPMDATLSLSGCETTLDYAPMGTNRFDLALYGRIETGRMHLELEYREDLWLQETIARQLARVVFSMTKAALGLDFQPFKLDIDSISGVESGRAAWLGPR